MSDKGIIFSASMVRSLLAGTKSQTRRLLKGVPEAPGMDSVVHPNPKHTAPYFDAYCGGKRTDLNPRGMTNQWCWWTRDDRAGHGCKVPYVPGDRLWVRETWRIAPYSCEGWVPDAVPCIGWIDYRAGGNAEVRAPSFSHVLDAFGKKVDVDWDCLPDTWRPSLFMPRWASRLTLTVTDVRVQRLQEISEADAIAEGIERSPLPPGVSGPATYHVPNYSGSPDAVGAYRFLWNSLHTTAGERWDDNPFVVAITFAVRKGNIDETPHA